jgi:GTPase SAR1 family protein
MQATHPLIGIVVTYPSEPTVFENYVHDLYVDGQSVELSLWDTAGASTSIVLTITSNLVFQQVKKSLTGYAH